MPADLLGRGLGLNPCWGDRKLGLRGGRSGRVRQLRQRPQPTTIYIMSSLEPRRVVLPGGRRAGPGIGGRLAPGRKRVTLVKTVPSTWCVEFLGRNLAESCQPTELPAAGGMSAPVLEERSEWQTTAPITNGHLMG